eukprot:466611_1
MLPFYTFILFICTISLMYGSRNYFKMISPKSYSKRAKFINKHRAQFMAINQIVDPPLDCNYVALPYYAFIGLQDEYNISDQGYIELLASPIDVCITDYYAVIDSPALNPASYKFVCDNNTVSIVMWFYQGTCDGAISYNTTVYSEFKCDAPTSCDYVTIEEYPADPSEPCVDGVIPSGISPGSRPFIVDTCFSQHTFMGPISMFISDCDSSGNIVLEWYWPNYYCNGSLQTPITAPPSPGTCDDDDKLIGNLECVLTTTTLSTTAISTTTTEATTTDVATTYPTVIITTFDDYSDSDDDSDDYSSDSDDDSDSRDDMFAAVANGALLEDEEEEVHYNVKIKFSAATLMNVYGLFAVFVIVNVFICCVCCQRKTSQKRASQLQSEDAFP